MTVTRHIVLVLFATLVLHVAAGDRMAVGATYNFAWGHNQSGFGLKFDCNLIHQIRLEPELIYSSEHDDITTLHLNVNLHYLVPLIDRLTLFPIAGLSYSRWGYQTPADDGSRWGANVGAGLEIDLGRQWVVVAEHRYQLVRRETQGLSGIGLKYRF